MLFSIDLLKAMRKQLAIGLVASLLVMVSVAQPVDASFIRLYPAFVTPETDALTVPDSTTPAPVSPVARGFSSGFKLSPNLNPNAPTKIRWFLRTTKPNCVTYADCKRHLTQVHADNLRRMSKIGRRSVLVYPAHGR